MSWDKYKPNIDPARPILISTPLHEAITKFTSDKGCTTQDIFNSGMSILYELYTGKSNPLELLNSEPETKKIEPSLLEPKDQASSLKVRNILLNNPMPKGKKNKHIYISFNGNGSYQWVRALEHRYFFNGIFNFIRRTISWYLRENNYLNDLDNTKIIQQIQEQQT